MSASVKFVLLITASPYTHQAADSALQFAKAVLRQGHVIEQVFFYHDGVYVGSSLISPEQAERNIAEQWSALAMKSDIPLIACSNSAMKRGVLDETMAKQQNKSNYNLNQSFKLAGLGQFVEAVVKSDKVVSFG